MLRLRPLHDNYPYPYQNTKAAVAKLKENYALYCKILKQSVEEKSRQLNVSIPSLLNCPYIDDNTPLIMHSLSFYIAYENNVPVGVAGINHNGSDLHIGNVYGFAIIPGARGRGLGTTLLNFIEYNIETRAKGYIDQVLKLRYNREFYEKIIRGNAHPTAKFEVHKDDFETIGFLKKKGYSLSNAKSAEYVCMIKKLSGIEKKWGWELDESLPEGLQALKEPPPVKKTGLGLNDYVRLDPDDYEDTKFWDHLRYIKRELIDKGLINVISLINTEELLIICNDHYSYIGSMLEWIKKNTRLYLLGLRNGFRCWNTYKNEDEEIRFDLSSLSNLLRSYIDSSILELP